MSVFCLEDAQMHFPDFRKARFGNIFAKIYNFGLKF